MAATGFIHYSEVHVAWLGDLFKERYKIIPTIISQVAGQIIRPSEQICAWHKAIVSCLQAKSTKMEVKQPNVITW